MSDRPMDWSEFQIARQLLAEERVGRGIRNAGRREDAEYNAAIAALSRG